jgi:phosphatidylglycerol:prolipoprotein diacylglycerol transferase
LTDYLLLPLAALPFPEIDPVIVQLGPLAIHWYGLGYVVGILFAWWYAKRLVTDDRLWPLGGAQIKPIDIDDFLLWAAAGIVLGGRLGYILFYDFARYAANPMHILAVWEGGMSFHGGLTGVTVAMIVFAWRRGFSPWSLFDVIAASAPVGFGVVRITNFINSELWGRPTDVPWAFVFPNGGPEPRHPSQLYEALLEGLVLFFVLRLLTHSALKLKQPGFVAGAMIAGYGLARIVVEFFRQPDAHIGYLAGDWLTMGMILSTPMVLLGIWAMLRARSAAS